MICKIDIIEFRFNKIYNQSISALQTEQRYGLSEQEAILHRLPADRAAERSVIKVLKPGFDLACAVQSIYN